MVDISEPMFDNYYKDIIMKTSSIRALFPLRNEQPRKQVDAIFVPNLVELAVLQLYRQYIACYEDNNI